MLTAAHCLAGGFRCTFVPGFSGHARRPTCGGSTPSTSIRAGCSRIRSADYAIARVSNEAGGSVEAHVGSGADTGHRPAPGTRVTVTGYPAGAAARPIGCQAGHRQPTSGFPSLACDGLVDGTSGAPWVSGTTVTG